MEEEEEEEGGGGGGHSLFPHPLQFIVLFSHNPTIRR
jgi:hypothetical protein